MKVLVIVSTGEIPKASLGIRWAAAAIRNGWVDDVEVVLFGPVEELVAKGEEQLIEPLAELVKLGKEPLACRRVADAQGITAELERRNVKTEYVGEIIAKLMAEGYVPLTF